jgi:hypothetical protein
MLGASGRTLLPLTRSRRVALLALPALAVLLVVIAAAAATRTGESSPALNQPAAVDVLSILLTLFGLTVAGLAAYMVWSVAKSMQLRRGRGAENGERVSRRAQILIGLAALGTLAVILSVIGLFGISQRQSAAGGAGGGPIHVSIPSGRTLPYSFTAGGVTAFVVVAAVLLIAFLPRLMRMLRSRSAPDFAHLGEREPRELALAGDTSAAELLAHVKVATHEREPDPRRAIVAAWIAMTTAMAEIFRPRLESEAPREYLDRALKEAGVRPSSAGRLTELFEEARFGGRAVGESLRTDAIKALAQVRDELRAHADVGVGVGV